LPRPCRPRRGRATKRAASSRAARTATARRSAHRPRFAPTNARSPLSHTRPAPSCRAAFWPWPAQFCRGREWRYGSWEFLLDVDKIADLRTEWFKYMNSALATLEAKLDEGTAPTDEEKQQLTEEFNKFKESFV